MNTVIPDFAHPLYLHNLEYEEVKDPDSGATQYVLINMENMDARWTTFGVAERSLDEAAKIAAKTATLLYTMGMDVEEDEREQEEWFKKKPIKKHKGEVNRIPNGTDPVEILKIISMHIRDNVLFNTAKEHNVHECCYKKIVNDFGVPEYVPIFDFDIDVAEEIIDGRQSNNNTVSDKYGLKEKSARVPLAPHDLYSSKVALKLAALLNEYDKQVVSDAAQLRVYITNKLIEISSCGMPKDELRALELLGKISDVGLFVEKSEVNVVHNTSASLEHAIKDRINRLLGYKNLDIEDAQYATPSNEEDSKGFPIADAIRTSLSGKEKIEWDEEN